MFAVGSATKPGDFTESLAAPDGHTLMREQGGLLWFVDDDTGRQTSRVPTSTRFAYHGWSPDSRWLWRSDRGLLEVWESATARLVAQRELTGTVAMAAFSHASDRVYVTLREEGVLLVLDRATLEPVGAPIELGALATGFAPDPDGQSVWVVAQDGAVRSVLPGSGEVEQVAPPGTFAWGTYDVDISPDGARALGSVGESAVQLFDTTTWAPMGPAAGRTEHDGTYDLSPDGLQFAALVADEIALYDGSTGARQATITFPDATSTTRIRYLPDSKGLLVTDQAGRTWTVDTRREAWVSRACGLAGRNLSQAEWREYFPGRTYEATCPQWPAGG